MISTGESDSEQKLVTEVVSLVKDVKASLHSLIQEWGEWQQLCTMPPPPPAPTLHPPPLNSPLQPPPLNSPLQPPSLNSPPLNSPLQPPPLNSPLQPPSPLHPPPLNSPPLHPPPLNSPPLHPPPLNSPLHPPPLKSPLHPPPLKSPVHPPPLNSPLQPPCNTPPSPSSPLSASGSPPYMDSQVPTTHIPSSNPASSSSSSSSSSLLMVQVPRSDLDHLATEALMLKELLPMVLNGYYTSCVRKVPLLEGQLGALRREKEGAMAECKKLHRRYDVLMADYEQEMREKCAARTEAQELQDMLTRQADYCSSMGSACSMLLWRVSRHEECIQSILSGSKVGEFLQLTGNTLISFLEAYRDSTPPNEAHPEAQFVLALCGTITNIAASTYGREFLCSCEDGRRLIDTLCSVLGTTHPLHHYCKLRGLVLMALYNISINQEGIKYLTSKHQLLSELVWLLQEERDSENRLHILKLIQSAVLEPGSAGFVQHALDTIPTSLVQSLTTDLSSEVQSVAMDLLGDLTALRRSSSY